MRRIPSVALVLAVFCPVVAKTQNDPDLAARIERITNRPEFKHALWGIEVYDADAGRVVYGQNEEKLFTPGSTTKLLSAGTALEMLGANHRFHTKVYRTGPIAKDGTLQGDLVLVASGDPNLSQRMQPDGTLAFENHDHSYGGGSDTKAVPGDPLVVIREFAQQVAAHGIRRISGRVLVDATLFPEGTRELGSGVVVSAISVNDNVLDVTIVAGATIDSPAVLSVSPKTAHVRFVNKVLTSAEGARESIDVGEAISNSDGSLTVSVEGSFPKGKPGIQYAYPVPVPSRFAEDVLSEALRAQGVTVPAWAPNTKSDFLALAKNYTESNVVAEHVSAPATEMIKVILKVSQNMHASAMPMLMGAMFGKDGENGFDVERKWLQKEGLDIAGAQQADGAGGDAHFSPAFMVSYLRMMSKRPDFESFHAALPILGKDGTLYNIQPQSPAAGHVHAKTGTFAIGDPLNRGVLVTGKGLAGYVTTVSGKGLIVAIYANNVAVSSAPDETTRVVGQALGEVAAAAYEYR
jgi:D-alanyl-D-alanine carboxypeptidase/D-alanyl-D-alanine-endopeptidase (penicillin-binding protein 4)